MFANRLDLYGVSVCTNARILVRGCVRAGVRARALTHPWQPSVQPAGLFARVV